MCSSDLGEVMSIGRSFTEAMQKAMRMVNEASLGFDEGFYLRTKTEDKSYEQELASPGPTRMWAVAHAFKQGKTIEDVHALTMIDRWFLSKLFTIHQMNQKLSGMGGLKALASGGQALLKRSKQYGFSDKQIASALGQCTAMDIFNLRDQWAIKPFVKQVDTLAAEFPAQTNYLYLTYVGSEHDVEPLSREVLPAYKDSLYDTAFGKGRLEEEHGWELPLKSKGGLKRQGSTSSPKLSPKQAPASSPPITLSEDEEKASFIVLGSGCYRIGASVEFDWCSVNAVRTLRETGHRAMVVNCNPETVSTDYDESDRLYFEELSLESVLEICAFENPTGTIISVGGQTPNNLAPLLHRHGVPILGTSPVHIDMAEDRSKFSALCDEMGIDQPQWQMLTSTEEALDFCAKVGYPCLVRPSYVLSGAAMNVAYSAEELTGYLGEAEIGRAHV